MTAIETVVERCVGDKEISSVRSRTDSMDSNVLTSATPSKGAVPRLRDEHESRCNLPKPSQRGGR